MERYSYGTPSREELSYKGLLTIQSGIDPILSGQRSTRQPSFSKLILLIRSKQTSLGL